MTTFSVEEPKRLRLADSCHDQKIALVFFVSCQDKIFFLSKQKVLPDLKL